MRIIELGGGDNPIYCLKRGNGVNVDVRSGPYVDMVADFEKPLPFMDGECDMVYSAFVLEHVGWRKVKQFIGEIYRVLKPGGNARVVTADLLEQCKTVADGKEWDENSSNLIFGGQDYPENTHRSGMSPEYARKLFLEAGFAEVGVSPLPTCATDMVIVAMKSGKNVSKQRINSEVKAMDETDLQKEYGLSYWDGTGKGYRFEGYRDFASHFRLVEEIEARRPLSVLDVGGARGYIVNKLIRRGVRAVCMDASLHCWHTRTTDSFILHDARDVPWPFLDKEFDLCFSAAFLEHVAEEDLGKVIREMARVTKRGLHTITFQDPRMDDNTHKTLKPVEWWREKFRSLAPDCPMEIITKTEAEYGPVDIAKYAPSDGLVKLNIGSFTEMHYYGWENADILDLNKYAEAFAFKFTQMDATKGLGKPDNSVDVILASHFLEHLDRREGEKFLGECLRVLKPRGMVRLATPDARLIAESYAKGEIFQYKCVNVGVAKARDGAEAFHHLLISGHKAIYDLDSLLRLLRLAGFTESKETSPFASRSEAILKQTTPMYPTLSCYVEAVKPQSAEPTSTYVSTHTSEKLRIGLISTRFFGVPPKGYSGLEMVLWDLACALEEMGHEITIFAPKGSQATPKGRLVETGDALNTVGVDWLKAEREAYEAYKPYLKDLDIINGHNWFGLEYAAKAHDQSLRVCHTHHGGLNLEFWGKTKPPFKLNLIAISKWMSDIYRTQGFESKHVYNGVDLSKYKFKGEKGDRLLFVGRIDCYDDQTEALTSEGFKPFEEVDYSTELATLSPEAKVHYHKPDAIQAYWHVGKMVRFIGKHLDLLVSEDNDLYCRRLMTGHKNPSFAKTSARDLRANFVKSKWEFTVEGEWDYADRDTFILPKCDEKSGRTYAWHARRDIPIDHWLKFFGWWMAEGHVYRGSDGKHYQACITQKNAAHFEEIRTAIKNTGFNCTENDLPDGTMQFFIHSKQLVLYLNQFGHARDKFIPTWIKHLPKQRLHILIDAMLKGDGSIKNRHINYFTTSMQLASDVQEIALRLGWNSTLKTNPDAVGRLCYAVSFNKQTTPRLWKSPVTVDYEGMIYDVTVKNHLILVRRNGKVCWSGNSFKQPHLAIDVANKLNMGLDVVGGTFVQDPVYLQQIRDACKGKVRFYPDAAHKVKMELMQDAKCLIFPSCMGEPFGLVAVEALSCGTKVVALNDGAIGEVVQEGGVVCDVYQITQSPQGIKYDLKRNPLDALIEGIKKAEGITPEQCRKNAEKFSRENMAKSYLERYYAILSGSEW